MSDKPDTNETATRIVRESTSTPDPAVQADLEAAWAQWSQHIQKVDERAMALLRAAFEAGWSANQRT